MKMFARKFGLALARRLGSKITDYQTGRPLGRALLITWQGKVHVIGLEAAVRPLFLPQKRMTYWKQTLVFTSHAPPDFPSLAEKPDDDLA